MLAWLLLAFVATLVASKKAGCPEPVDIAPCKCTNSPFTYLECQHLDDSDTLRKVFELSSGYKFHEVHIKYSNLQFLPSDLFDKVQVGALYLKNVTLIQLFDNPPQGLAQLDTLHIEATKLLRGILAQLLEPLTHLRILTVYYNTIRVLGPEFTKHLAKDIQQISFYDTATKEIKPGTLKEFDQLDKFAMDSCKLTKLTRDIFANPFNGRILYFNKNELTSLPGDMFANMPNLQTVGLNSNHLSVLPATVFRGSLAKLDFLMLNDNPLICDCRINWLVKHKPPALSGHCSAPVAMKGKQIKDLTEDFLDC